MVSVPTDKDSVLKVGDICWCLRDGRLYVVKIAEAKRYDYSSGEQDGKFFMIYGVTVERKHDSTFQNFEGKFRTVHRSDLFVFPDEVERLSEECETIVDRFKDYMKMLEQNHDPKPEIVNGVRLIDMNRIREVELGEYQYYPEDDY